MKKFPTFLLTMCMLAAFGAGAAACGEGQSSTESEGTSVSTENDSTSVSTENDSTTSEESPAPAPVVTTVTEEEWDAAFTVERFSNVTVEWTEGYSDYIISKFTEELCSAEFQGSVSIYENGSEDGLSPAEFVEEYENYIGAFANYTYDETTKSYKGKRQNNSESEIDVEFKFENGFLVWYTMLNRGSYMKFYDYGTTVVELITTVTEEEWKAMFEATNFTMTSLQYDANGGEDDEPIELMRVTENACTVVEQGEYYIKQEGLWYHLDKRNGAYYLSSMSEYDQEKNLPFALLDYDFSDIYSNFTYDETEKAYVNEQAGATVYVENKQLVAMEIVSGTDMKIVITLTDYGRTTIEVPEYTTEAAEYPTTVTEAEWDAMLALKNFTISSSSGNPIMLATETAFFVISQGDYYVRLEENGFWFLLQKINGSYVATYLVEEDPTVNFSFYFVRLDLVGSYSDFTYDATKNAYVNEDASLTLYFENKTLVSAEVVYGMSNTANTAIYRFSNYGTTTIDVPEYTVPESATPEEVA